MHSIIYLSIGIFAALAVAQNNNPFEVPSGGYGFGSGSQVTISWKPTTTGPVNILLQSGENTQPSDGVVLGTDLPNNGMYVFTFPSVSPTDNYFFRIFPTGDPQNSNFSPRFTVEGPVTSTSELLSSTTDSSSQVSSTDTSTSTSTSTSTDTSASSSTSTETITSSSTLSTSFTSTTSTTSSTTSSSSSASPTPIRATNTPNPNAAMSLMLPGSLLLAVLGLIAFL
ncbi:hypothetical protein PABG_00068 [Paracoccidioides brasiliensis Pb03]|nr:hypothetical protein PABG_00068 [Paracoccidioides brasiliensis Pb03]